MSKRKKAPIPEVLPGYRGEGWEVTSDPRLPTMTSMPKRYEAKKMNINPIQTPDTSCELCPQDHARGTRIHEMLHGRFSHLTGKSTEWVDEEDSPIVTSPTMIHMVEELRIHAIAIRENLPLPMCRTENVKDIPSILEDGNHSRREVQHMLSIPNGSYSYPHRELQDLDYDQRRSLKDLGYSDWHNPIRNLKDDFDSPVVFENCFYNMCKRTRFLFNRKSDTVPKSITNTASWKRILREAEMYQHILDVHDILYNLWAPEEIEDPLYPHTLDVDDWIQLFNRLTKMIPPDYWSGTERNDYLAWKHIHEYLNGYVPNYVPPSTERSQFDEFDKDPVLDEWGNMKILEPKLTVKYPSWKLAKATMRATDSGVVPRNMHRYTTDQRIFGRHKKVKGTSLLIDDSGSMGLSEQEIKEVIDLAPASIIGVYSGTNGIGELKIVAKDGVRLDRSVSSYKTFGQDNMIDYPALKWLAQQPWPRLWYSDGQVTSMSGYNSRGVKQCFDLAKDAGIVQTPYLQDLKETIRFNKYVQPRQARYKPKTFNLHS